MIGTEFTYTAITTNWLFGKKCLITGEVGGCWTVRAVGFPDHKEVWMNKSMFPMKEMSEEEILEAKKKVKLYRRVR